MSKGKEIQRWADKAMYQSEPMQGEDDREDLRPRVYLLMATPDPLGAIAAASMMYEGKVCRNIIKDITDHDRGYYWQQSQKTHLRAPHEFVDFHFLVEGVTRSFTHQMVRQRTAVYAQESLRFAVKEGFADEVPRPPSIPASGEGGPHDTGQIWVQAIDHLEEAYETLVNMGVPAEDARGLLPHSITTRLHYKTNLRNLVEHAGNRLCTQAQFEWRQVLAEMVKAIREYRPLNNLDANWQFETIANSDLFRPVCYAQSKCPFTADYDRGCTIRGRVEEGKFDQIDPQEWLLDPAAARR